MYHRCHPSRLGPGCPPASSPRSPRQVHTWETQDPINLASRASWQPCLLSCQQPSELTFQPGSKARAKGQSLPSSHGQACVTAAPSLLLLVNPFLASASRRKHGTHLLKFYCANCPTYHEIALTAGGPELWLSALILAMSLATLHLSPAPLAPGLGSIQHQDLGSWEFPSRLSGYASDEYP